MPNERLPKNNRLLETARTLRREMTRHEKHLWYDFLQKYPMKIYKQRIIGNFIVDFYCAAARLVIEVDGRQHETPEGRHYDELRSAFLEEHGLKVIRFSNHDIDTNFMAVCNSIDQIIKENIQQ